jgi:hypothetical protein
MVLSIAWSPSERGCCDFWQRHQTHGKHRAMVNALKNIHVIEGAGALGGQPCLFACGVWEKSAQRSRFQTDR